MQRSRQPGMIARPVPAPSRAVARIWGNAGARFPAATAVLLFVLFVGWTVWRLATGAHWLDANATRLTGLVLRGVFDVFVSSLWPFGEPQLGGAVAALLTAGLAAYRRWHAAALLVACYAVLSATELGMRASIGLAQGQSSLRQALVHGYPSGHAARIPFLGAAVAMLVPRRWRLPVLAATAALMVLEALDRVDSTLQTASDVVGGTLMGTWLALTFAALLPAVERRPTLRLRHRR